MEDGKIYETLLDWAKTKNPLNGHYFADGYEHIQKMAHVTPRPHL